MGYAHCNYIVKKANKRLYAIRVLKKCGLSCTDFTLVCFSIIRSILEYASSSPVGAALPLFLSDLIESVQKRALLFTLSQVMKRPLLHPKSRREEFCIRFMKTIHDLSPPRVICCVTLIIIMNKISGLGIVRWKR